ncbi:MAG TPA: hypothetical protein VKX40_17030 [Aequorivita sp.]|nr:hypothetical protein [Aequorivita sp.]
MKKNINFLLFLHPSVLDSLITSKTRVKLLIKFFSNSGNRGYLRGLAEEFQESTNSIRVELNRLSDAGLLVSKPDGKTKSYQANQQHPLFSEMKSIVSKYLGFDRLVEVVIKNLGNVEKALVMGDYAKGVDSGTIELVLIGKEINLEYLKFLVEKAEEKIQRKVVVQVLKEEPQGIEGLIVFDVV